MINGWGILRSTKKVMGIKNKKELITLIICIVFVLMNLGAIGSAGRKRAKELVCLSNLLKWGKVFEIYTTSNDGKFPRRTGSTGRWIDTMCNYHTTNEDIRLCPMVTKIANPNMSVGVDWWGGTFLGWGKVPAWDASSGRTIGVYGSYGINGYVYVPGSDPIYKPAKRFWGTINVEGASDIPMLLDCYFWCGWPDDDDTPPEYDGWQERNDQNAMNRYCLNRHEGSINCVFLNLNARKVGLKELWTLNWHRGFNRANAWTLAGGVISEDWAHWGNGWMANFKNY
jgi:hypothetical protein